MEAKYIQQGNTLDYMNETLETIKGGTVVELTTRVGVAAADILPATKGAVHVVGVYEMKKTGVEEIAAGQAVYFDKTGITNEAASNTPAGIAAEKTAAGATKILVRIG